ILDEFVEVIFELLKATGASERFVEAKEGEDDISLVIFQCMAMIFEALRPRPQHQLVSGPTKIADDEFEIGKAAVEQRLKIAEILHPLGERVADQDDVIALVQRELGLVGGRTNGGENKK